MTITLLGALVVLALIDSTSFGTLVIPLWLMASPGRIRPGRVLVFLGTVAAFYWSVGLAILWGAGWAVDGITAVVASPVGMVALLGVGVALIVWSYRLEAKAKREKREGIAVSGRTARWRDRALGVEAGPTRAGLAPLVLLALTATTVELGSMLPYLGAIGSIVAAGLPWGVSALVLAGYCVVMVLPAVVLLAARILARRRVEPALGRLEAWITRNASETLSWVVGIIGVLAIIQAVRSGLLPFLG
jgi:hypothetical protein